MKIIPLKGLLALLAITMISIPVSLFASIEDQGDGTYKVEGYFYFNTELEIVAPWGKNNNFGEFSSVIFKGEANHFPNIQELNQNSLTMLLVKAQANPHPEPDKEPIFVVTEILEWEGAPDSN